MRRVALFCAAAIALVAADARAQNSVFGVLGVGFPARPIGVRSRALGGGFSPFDARSALNPASVSGYQRLAGSATSGTTLRNYTALDSVADGLRETRFPFGMLGGSVEGTPISFAVSYSSYAERTYEITTRDTIALRGEEIAVVDRFISDGGVVDLRGAVGVQVVGAVRLGAALHMLGGSARISNERDFASARYAPLRQRSRLGFSGIGFSAGIIFTPAPRLALAASVRSDRHLDATRDSVAAGTVDLPITLNGAFYLAPHPAIGWSTMVEWRSWSDAAGGFGAGTERAFDTWEIATGIEIGGASAGTPLRLGARYAQLPFSPSAERPYELTVAAGTGIQFARNLATLDMSLERATRRGAGARETAWHLAFGLTVRP